MKFQPILLMLFWGCWQLGINAPLFSQSLSSPTNRILIERLVPGQEQVLDYPGLERVCTSGTMEVYQMEVTYDLRDPRLLAQLAQIRRQPGILRAEPDHRYYASMIPSDSAFRRQWGLRNQGFEGGKPGLDIDAIAAWDIQTGSDTLVVGVLDSGVDWQHPDLVENIWQNLGEDADGDGHVLELVNGVWQFDPGDQNGIDDDGNGFADDFIGWDFFNNDNDPTDDHLFSHGTHVAGIIAARGNNSRGVTGVSWRSKIMPLKFLNADGGGFASGAIQALDYARTMGADMTNNSWGGGGFNQSLSDAIGRVGQAGQLFIAAAGNNNGNNNDRAALYPASYPQDHIISVLATDFNDTLPRFTNIGPATVDLGAPGLGIYSTIKGGYAYLSGTSMAAPFVAGAALLVWSEFPNFNAARVKEQLLRSVDFAPALLGKCVTSGRLNLFRAVVQPARFQATLSPIEGSDLTTTETGGYFLFGGTDGFELGNLNREGQTQWGVQWGTGTGARGSQLLLSPGNQLWLTGSGTGPLGGQDGLLAQLDTSRQVNFAFAYGSSGDDEIKAIAQPEPNRWWISGTTNGFGLANPAGWVAELDSFGTVRWGYALSYGNYSVDITAMEAYPEGGGVMAGNLTRPTDTAAFVVKLDDTGQVDWSEVFRLAGYAHIRIDQVAISLEDGDSEDIALSGIVRGTPGTFPILVLLEDEEVEEIVRYQVPQPGGNVQVAARQLGWAVSTALDIGGTFPLGLLLVEEEGEVESAWAYQANNRAASGVSFVKHPDQGWAALAQVDSLIPYLVKSDPSGFSGCLGSNPVISEDQNGIVQVLNLPVQSRPITVGRQILTRTLATAAYSDTVFCTNVNCSTVARATLSAQTSCENGSVQFVNNSVNASQFRWEINGLPEASSTNFTFQPGDTGLFEITLIAQDGVCTDSRSFFIPVAPEPVVSIRDTTHCGAAVRINGPAGALRYSWKDLSGNVLDTNSVFILRTSGTYELEVEDACGNTADDQFLVTLQPGCVWPGDVNTDGEVNMVDFLQLGLVQGQTGPARPNASLAFTSQNAPDWGSTFSPTNTYAAAINLKHADCDGNGTLNVTDDARAIAQNYRTFPASDVDSLSSGTVLSLFSNQNALAPGDTLEVEVQLTTQNGANIANAYGVAFQLNYNIPLQNSPGLTTTGSWLGMEGQDMARLQYLDTANLRLDVGLVRLNQVNRVGKGTIAKGIIIVVVDDIGIYGPLAERAFFTMTATRAILIQNDGSEIPVSLSRTNHTVSLPLEIPRLSFDAQAWLQGPFKLGSNEMSTDLYTQGLLPLNSPYATAPQNVPFLPPRTVDWVMIELRDENDVQQVVLQQAALIRNNGSIVDPVSREPLVLSAASGNYYVALWHRNHLRVVTRQPVTFSGSRPTILNFSDPNLFAGNSPLVEMAPGQFGLWAGDVDQNGEVKFSGPGNDRRLLLLELNGEPTAVSRGYLPEDVNLDGEVNYLGPGNDREAMQPNGDANTINQSGLK
ncbi:MAG: S8 family peptidase [Bacteroidota bacterium]